MEIGLLIIGTLALGLIGYMGWLMKESGEYERDLRARIERET